MNEFRGPRSSKDMIHELLKWSWACNDSQSSLGMPRKFRIRCRLIITRRLIKEIRDPAIRALRPDVPNSTKVRLRNCGQRVAWYAKVIVLDSIYVPARVYNRVIPKVEDLRNPERDVASGLKVRK